MIPPMNKEKTAPLAQSLIKLEKLYEVGDYKQAKQLAKSLLDTHQPTGKERARIDKVLGAIKIDPAAVIAFVVTLGLMTYLFIKYST